MRVAQEVPDPSVEAGATSASAYARAVAIDSLGRVILAGEGEDLGHVARLLPSGDLDLSFSGDGKAKFLGEGPFDLAINDQNDMFASGATAAGMASQFALGRFGVNERPDRHLDRNGIAITTFGRQQALRSRASSLSIVGERVYVAGTVWRRGGKNPKPDRFALFRYKDQ